MEKQIRVHKDLLKEIDYIRAKHLMQGKKMPSYRELTKKIAKIIKKEGLLRNEFIKI